MEVRRGQPWTTGIAILFESCRHSLVVAAALWSFAQEHTDLYIPDLNSAHTWHEVRKFFVATKNTVTVILRCQQSIEFCLQNKIALIQCTIQYYR